MPRSTIARISVFIALAVAFVAGESAPARAQLAPINGLTALGASSAMLDTLKSHKHLASVTAPPPPASAGGADAVPPPITDSDQTKAAFLLPAVTYQVNLALQYGSGPTGSIRGALPGTADAGVIVRIEPRTRIAAAFYQLAVAPIGYDSGVIPIEIQNNGVLTQEDLNSFQPDATTDLNIYVFAIERLFTIHNSPLVATFAYDSQNATTPPNNRGAAAFYVDGVTKNVFTRDAQHYNLVISEPFVLNDQKLFIIFNEQIQQLVHNAGFNEAPNRPHLLYSAFFQYDANEKASFFFEPAKNVAEFPTDRYANNQAVFVYGVTYKLRRPFFVQASITSLTTTNPDYDGTGRIGITHVTIACPPNTTGGTGFSPTCLQNLTTQNTTATLGGTKFTTIQLSVGIGTPPVYIPF